ncbi:MAG: DUF4383 domain-containing protein [Actinomycetota bacterium]|nr:DUF4383 domain-containing protein [Actinomycetota bacterium]
MGQGYGASDSMNVARVAALLLGLGYVAAGVIGFVVTGFTGFVEDTDEQLLGLDLNIFHNIVHLAIGAGLAIASQMRDVAITQGVLIGVGLFYILAALLGFIDYLQIISVNYSLSMDNFFHLITGLTAFIFGLIGARQLSQSLRPGRMALAAEGPRPIEERRSQWDKSETYREETY